jgi:hydrogenase maturation factor
MKVGKVPPEILKQYIFGHLGIRRQDVLVHSSLGEDCSVIDFGDEVCVLSSDPITGAVKDIGRLAVNISCNDIAANGADPVGVLITILAPEGTTAEDFGRIMRQVDEAAKELGIEVLGGHSEITAGIDRVIISTTAVGRARKSEYLTSSGAKPGYDLVVTKGAGLEGTAILATDFEGSLLSSMTLSEIQRAQSFIDLISVVKDGQVARKHGATAMHDVTEGGILGAAYEMAVASNCGIELRVQDIPIYPETRAVCAYFQIDPFALVSSGAMLIASADGNRTRDALIDAGINAAVIGRFIPEGFYLIRENHREAFQAPERDELWKVFESS